MVSAGAMLCVLVTALAVLSSATATAKQPPPKEVRVLDRVLGFSSLTVWWKPPEDTHAITGYSVMAREASDAGAEYQAVANTSGPDACWTEVEGLRSGTPYTFKVSPLGAFGIGEASGATEQVILPNTVPAAPRNVAPKQVAARHVRLVWEVEEPEHVSQIR